MFAGGCVRDQLLGRDPKDYDVVTDATPDRVAELFRRTQKVGAKFGVVLVHVSGMQIEVATFRVDGDYSDGRHPDNVTFGNQIDDARRRDFTINGMFFDVVRQQIIDHVGGRRDLEDGIIRAIGDPDRRFAEDHLRMVRAVRFCARLGFVIEDQTLEAIRRQAHLLRTISPERVREELRMTLESPSRADGWRWICSAGLAAHILPGVPYDAQDQATVATRIAALPDNAGFTVVLAALLASLPPKRAGEVCSKFTSPNYESRGVSWLLTQLPRVRNPDNLDLADIKLLVARAGFVDLCALLRADLAAASLPPDPFEAFQTRANAIPPAEVAPPPFISGDDLVARNVPKGPIYADILTTLYHAQLNDEISDRPAAIARLEELIPRA